MRRRLADRRVRARVRLAASAARTSAARDPDATSGPATLARRLPAALRGTSRYERDEIALLLHSHFPEHARFHVVLQRTVIGPPAERVRGDAVRALRSWRHIDRVLADLKRALVVLQIAPHPVQMNRMRHHRIVDEHDPH